MTSSDLPEGPGKSRDPGSASEPVEKEDGDSGAAIFRELEARDAALAAPAAEPAPPSEESEEEFDRKIKGEALQATEVYSEAVSAARQVYRALENPLETEGIQIPRESLKKLISVVRADNQEILILADRSAPDSYLYGHVVNVAVFSLRLGMTVGLSDEEMLRVATGAFLHDIGMIPFLPLVLRPNRLTEEEVKQVRSHAEEGVKLLVKFTSLTGEDLDVVSSIVWQVHERMEGMGYPQALGEKDIHPLAKLVGVCDMYESLTHMRSWRSRLLPHHVLRVMIEEHERTFEPGLVKSLVESLSLYPPGSFVRLSSGDVGRVVAINKGLPTRPKVKVLVDSQGRRVAAPSVLNLAAHPILYVADAVDETKLPTSDQRLLLELRAQRWWVRGF
jgi:HD-GYP domain-containing protein (c-di-GMP phosphodiesterase class II)